MVAGDGEDRAKAEARIAELGLREHGRMLGHVDSMPRFYACLDCLVMPSHWEPHGLAHLEAQSFGVPVIVSDVPGLRSTVHAEDDALLVPPHDPAAIAAGVQRLAGDPQLRGRLVAGGLANSALYSMGAFTRGLDEVYASLATARAERREAA